MKLITTVLTLIFAWLAYNFYVPLTPGYGWQMSYEGSKLLLIEKSVMVADSLGFDSAKLFRHILRIVYGSGTAPRLDPHVEFQDLAFDGVPVRLYKPKADKSLGLIPGVVIYHGGGWTIGSADDIHSESCRLSRELQAGVLSVAYRLAPEHVFPAPFDDCLAATKYLLSNAHTFGVDSNRIALKGLSAGGALVAGVALALRDANFKPLPKLQVIVNAPLQALCLDTPSYQFNVYNAFQTKSALVWFLGNYLFGHQEYYNKLMNNRHVSNSVVNTFLDELLSSMVLPRDEIRASYVFNANIASDKEFWNEHKGTFMNEYAFPLMAKNLTGLPKAHVYTCYSDVLRDDGILYAWRLRNAGNDVMEMNLYQCHHLWNVFHEFDQHSTNLYNTLITNIANEFGKL